MVEDLGYTKEEWDALWDAAGWTSIRVTREVFEYVIGAYTNKRKHKLTPGDIRDFATADDLGRGTDPNANKAKEGEASSGKGGRQFGEGSAWLLLGIRIKGALLRDEEPFGVPDWMVSKEQWEAAIGGRIGENLIRYIAGVSAEQGAHFNSAQALINRQKRSDKEVDAEITSEQLATLIDQKIMDIDVLFRPLVRFLYAANDLRKEDVAKQTTYNRISILLEESNAEQFIRSSIQTAADLLLPKDTDGKPNHDHLGMWFQKAREADRDSGIERTWPLIQRSEQLVVAVWRAVEGELENYRQGLMLKSELPRAIEILQLLERLSLKQEESTSIRMLFGERFQKKRQKAVYSGHTSLKSEEWEFFQTHLGLSDAEINILKQLPVGVDSKLNLPSPEYILNHPEHYDTFGKWLKAMREAAGMSLEDVAEKLGVEKQAIHRTEQKKAESAFSWREGQTPIPVQYLNVDPYGIFPQTQEFRERFIALSEPNVMKPQHEEAAQWITQEQLHQELGLQHCRRWHNELLGYWNEKTIGLANGDRGTIAIRGGYIDVKRGDDGELRFHKSSIPALKADPEIQAQLARQQQSDKQR